MSQKPINEMSLSELAAEYNRITGKSIKKFRDLATGRAKLAEVQPAASTPAKKGDGRPTEARVKNLPGPRSQHAGKRLYKKVEGNPRKEGTAGWHSFNLIEDGMTYEQYRFKGGRTNDLAWDIAHDYVEVR